MTYVVTDACIRCKFTDCVSVCPVDCFHEGANMLVINPDECIDCAVCVPECPVDAIQPDDDARADAWLEHNATYAALWPVITKQIAAPADAENWRAVSDKIVHFDPLAAAR
jgi:ferredoxin